MRGLGRIDKGAKCKMERGKKMQNSEVKKKKNAKEWREVGGAEVEEGRKGGKEG